VQLKIDRESREGNREESDIGGNPKNKKRKKKQIGDDVTHEGN
jgi:hypothetical protein